MPQECNYTEIEDRWIRWNDGGELQSVEHLAAIAAMARKTEGVRHLLPTGADRIVLEWLAAGNTRPANLNIRLMIDGPTPEWATAAGLTVATTHSFEAAAPEDANPCGAPMRGNQCVDCRLCWNPKIARVSHQQLLN
ncbi:MAG TPA: hypothetical protein VGG60_05065 [Candidatus Binataceae bacterium]|jgi:hypothetical protein